MEALNLNKNLSLLEGDPNEYIMGMPRHLYFKPNKMQAMVIVASDYSALRENEGKDKYFDLPETTIFLINSLFLPETKEDCQVILDGIRKFGFADEDIVILEDPSWNQVHLKVIEMAMNLQKDAMQGIKTLFYFYYAGHGLSDNNLHLQLNEPRLYPIEKMLRSLAKADGSYVIALFDCCRERLVAGATRGTGADEDDGLAAATQALPEYHENFIITFGCPPTEGVPAKSTIAKAYMKYLKKSSDQNGYISLPGPLNFFVGDDGKCEHNIKVAQPLLMRYQKKQQQEQEQVEEEEEEEDDGAEFYDFHEPMKNPDILIAFEDQRQLFDIEFTANQQLLVESSFIYQQVEVYQIEKKEQMEQIQPIIQMDTEAKGLSAIKNGSDRIYFGYQGSMLSTNVQIQAWSLDYEKIAELELEIEDNFVTEMVLCHNEQFLVCTHNNGLVTVIRTEDMSLISTSAPFEETHGTIENFSNLKRINPEFVNIFEKLVFASTQGLFVAMLTAEGEIQTADEAYFKGCNVTNCEIIQGDLVICTLNDEEGTSKIMTVNVDTEEVDLVLEQGKDLFAFDLEKVPCSGDDHFFILHQNTGLDLIDPINKKSYNLRMDKNENYGVCKSVTTRLIDDEDPDRGFWLANIDNTNPFAPQIKVYDFNAQFIEGLKHISEKIKMAKTTGFE